MLGFIKKTISVSAAAAAILFLYFSAAPAAEPARIQPAQYGMPGHMTGAGSFYGSFKIADLDLDGSNEIILLRGGTLYVMNTQGEVQITKEVEGLNSRVLRGGGHMGGNPGGGNGGWNWGYPMGVGHMGGGSLEVADIDGDPNPEIIIMGYDELIVLDHNGDPQTAIELPEIDWSDWY